MPRKVAISTLAQKGHLPALFGFTYALLGTFPVGVSALVGECALSAPRGLKWNLRVGFIH